MSIDQKQLPRCHQSARFLDWRARLTDYLAANVHRPFVYGQHDCALFVFGAVDVMTGSDHCAPYRDRYATMVEAISLLRKLGHRDHVEMVGGLFEEVIPTFAQVGDIAILDGADGPALGLVQGELIYALVPTGMVLVPLTAALRAFRVA